MQETGLHLGDIIRDRNAARGQGPGAEARVTQLPGAGPQLRQTRKGGARPFRALPPLLHLVQGSQARCGPSASSQVQMSICRVEIRPSPTGGGFSHASLALGYVHRLVRTELAGQLPPLPAPSSHSLLPRPDRQSP